MNISVVVPVYNSQNTLKSLVQGLTPVLNECADNYEIILVNDGSPDNSWEVIEQLARDNTRVRGIRLMRNYGQHNALLCGIRSANFDITVTLDDDLQNPPEEMPKLLAKLGEGFDVVYGKPRKQKHSLMRALASRMTKVVLQGMMGAEAASSISPYRAFRTDLRKAFQNYSGPSANLDVLLTWGTRKFAAVEIRQDERISGESNYTLMKLITHALNMTTGFSSAPLQFASLNGFLFMFFGVGILIYIGVRYLLWGSVVPGFPFLASVIAIFAGAQLLSLGIMGEYLARIHGKTLEYPSYVVRDEVFSSTQSQLIVNTVEPTIELTPAPRSNVSVG